MTGYVLLLKTNKPTPSHYYYADGPLDLKFMQELVGGYVEAIPLPGTDYVLCVNEDAKMLKDVPADNECATHVARHYKAIREENKIIGNAFIAALIDNNIAAIRPTMMPIPTEFFLEPTN